MSYEALWRQAATQAFARSYCSELSRTAIYNGGVWWLDDNAAKVGTFSLKAWYFWVQDQAESFTGFIERVRADEPSGVPMYRLRLDSVEAAAIKVDLRSTAPAINDHVCPTCQNTRCSKSEVTCWSCGNKL